MKAREQLPSLNEIKAHNADIRAAHAPSVRTLDDEEEPRNVSKVWLCYKIQSIQADLHATQIELVQSQELVDFLKDAEALQAAKLAKMATELEATKAKLEAAESEAARLELVAMEGAEALARDRENSTRIKRESDAVREENQRLRMQIDALKSLTVDTLRRLPRLDELDKWHALEALREAVE